VQGALNGFYVICELAIYKTGKFSKVEILVMATLLLEKSF